MSDNIGYTPGTGATIAADDISGVLYQRVKLTLGDNNTDDGDVSENNPVPVSPRNIVGIFRESFNGFTPGVIWTLTTGSGDIVQLDGNAISSSYLVISKDPLSQNTETTLTYDGSFPIPIETAVGLSMSQRVLGQEASLEIVSTETPLTPPSDVAISSISQTTTTLTVNTSTAHNLSAGMSIGIKGCADSRLNYPALVVATTPSSTQFTCTAGPMGTITSATLSGGAQGDVYVRSRLGYAQNGVSQIFENASITNSSSYTRTASGDALPSGTLAGNQSLTTATTASNQAINSPYTFAFLPSSEYRFIIQSDRAQLLDVGVDSASAPTSRSLRTQVVPDPTKDYTLRFRVTNNASLTIPTAKIVSAVKSGSTTATITTDGNHGLTTSDFIVIYGIQNQTNFANLTTATVVASVPTSTTFTIAFGASATATSYGGMVSRVNGFNIPAAFSTIAIQSAVNNGTELTLVGSANWTWLVGDYVNVYGCRDISTGADMGVDGSYKVVFVSTTTMRLIPIGSTTLPSAFASTNAGGTVVKRTDLRVAFVRIFDYLRERVEVQPNTAAAASVPIQGSVSISSGTVSTASLAANLLVADISSAALTSNSTSSTITPAASSLSQEFNVVVTAVSGTNPTLDVVVQESTDTGTNWIDTYHFPRITAAGQYRSPLIPLTGNRIRYIRTVGGSTPSFTNAVNRIQSHTSNPLQRQFFDRTVAPNSLNSTSPSFFTEGCADLVVLVNMGAITTTAPTFALQISADGTNFVQLGADITTTANTTSVLQVSNAQASFSRLLVKSAGSGATLGYVMIKGTGN